MAKFTVKVRPTGLINGREWPEPGEVIELPATVGAAMSETGWLSPVEETRPAPAQRVEKRRKA